MFDLPRPQSDPSMSEKCVLVHAYIKNDFKNAKTYGHSENSENSENSELSSPNPTQNQDLHEFKKLVNSTPAQIEHIFTSTKNQPNPKYFIGKGKLEEIKSLIKSQNIQLVIFNNPLSPSQQRNIEQSLECRVLDRTGLILDIFAQRAQTFEGKLQVELAQLQYLSTRLVRGWTHLERQKGGIGLRGPGEKQLELDKRMLNQRIKNIKASLLKVRKRRDLSRASRKKSEIPTISLVGYTNAGKSTLFNSLATANILTANKLFATLDPTLRKITIPKCGEAILADTVGFIQNLPHELIESFRATLEETQLSDLIIHVIDGSNPEYLAQMDAVNQVLSELNTQDIPKILVYNKSDKLSEKQKESNQKNWVSAIDKSGFDNLFAIIKQKLKPNLIKGYLTFNPNLKNLGQIRAQLY